MLTERLKIRLISLRKAQTLHTQIQIFLSVARGPVWPVNVPKWRPCLEFLGHLHLDNINQASTNGRKKVVWTCWTVASPCFSLGLNYLLSLRTKYLHLLVPATAKLAPPQYYMQNYTFMEMLNYTVGETHLYAKWKGSKENKSSQMLFHHHSIHSILTQWF